MKNNFDKIVILIPALNPNEGIIKLVKELKEENFFNIIVINDGSNEENRKYFDILKNEYDIKVLKHDVNYGKGKALKNGIKEVYNENVLGVVTVDADGQHLVKDVKKVAEKLKEEKIVLGERDFKSCKEVPLASKIGNKFSSLYFKLLTGIYLKDTSTGLRGIPKKYFDIALNTQGDRYDFEINFLKEMYYNKLDFNSVNIEIVYENRIKNYRIIKDSIIIYKEFFKNLISSLICAIVDIVLFWIFTININYIFLSNVLARICSGILDFTINKFWVCNKKDSKKTYSEFIKYTILFIVQMLLNSLIVTVLSNIFEAIILIKLLVNLILYIVNFFIKNRYIFI